jgi:hypothetical protein
MARKTITVSDISGEPITDSDHAKVVITHGRDRYETDVSLAEIQNLVDVSRKTKRRGRKPASEA